MALVASAALAAVESRATDSAEKKYAGTASPVCSSAEACTCEGVCSRSFCSSAAGYTAGPSNDDATAGFTWQACSKCLDEHCVLNNGTIMSAS